MASLHPKILDIPDLDAIAILSQAPRNTIHAPEGTTEILMVGSESIHLSSSSRKEIQAAVRKAKSADKMLAAPALEITAENTPAAADVEPPIPETAATEPAVYDSPGFSNELDEAASALANHLRSLPREGALSNLASVIEEARILLEMTKRQLLESRRIGNTGDSLQVELH